MQFILSSKKHCGYSRPKYASIQPETLKINEKLAENIAKQIIVAIKIQQIKIAQEEEDIETLLLIA